MLNDLQNVFKILCRVVGALGTAIVLRKVTKREVIRALNGVENARMGLEKVKRELKL